MKLARIARNLILARIAWRRHCPAPRPGASASCAPGDGARPDRWRRGHTLDGQAAHSRRRAGRRGGRDAGGRAVEWGRSERGTPARSSEARAGEASYARRRKGRNARDQRTWRVGLRPAGARPEEAPQARTPARRRGARESGTAICAGRQGERRGQRNIGAPRATRRSQALSPVERDGLRPSAALLRACLAFFAGDHDDVAIQVAEPQFPMARVRVHMDVLDQCWLWLRQSSRIRSARWRWVRAKPSR